MMGTRKGYEMVAGAVPSCPRSSAIFILGRSSMRALLVLRMAYLNVSRPQAALSRVPQNFTSAIYGCD